MIDSFQIVPSDTPILKRARDLGIWVDANLSPTYISPPDYCYRYLSTNEINKIPTKKWEVKMVTVDQANIVKLKTHGFNFEILVDSNAAMAFKGGANTDIRDVLAVQ